MFFTNRRHRPLIWVLSAALLICGALIFHLTKSKRASGVTAKSGRSWTGQLKVAGKHGETIDAPPNRSLGWGLPVAPDSAEPGVFDRSSQHDARDVQLDRDAQALAARLLSENSEETVELRKQLESVIERHFEHRQQQRKREIEQLSERIDALRLSQIRRQENKTEVVKRRLNDLIDPTANLDWDTSQSTDDKKRTSDRRQASTPQTQSAGSNAQVQASSPVVAGPPDLPGPPVVSSASSMNVTYQGRPISVWLAKLETERDPHTLVTAVDALQHLSADIEPSALIRAMIQMAQSIRLRVPFDWSLRRSPVYEIYPDVFSLVDRSIELLRSTLSSILVETLVQQLNEIPPQNVTDTIQAIFNGLLVSAVQSDQSYATQTNSIRINKGLAREFSEHAQEVIDALTSLAKRNDGLEEWAVDSSLRILTLNDGTLSKYPELVPMVQRFLLNPTTSFDMRGEAAVTLGRSGLFADQVLMFLQSALEKQSEGDARQIRQRNDRRVRAWVKHLAPAMPQVVMLLRGQLSDQTGQVQIYPESSDVVMEWIRLLHCLVDLRESAESTLPWLRELADRPMAETPTPFVNLVDFDGKPIRSRESIRDFLKYAIQEIEIAVSASRAKHAAHEQDLPQSTSTGVGLAPKQSQTSAPTSPPREPTFDGRAYSAWLDVLENERKPALLEAAIDACSRLAQPNDQARIACGILQAASHIQKGGIGEPGELWNVAYKGLRRIDGESILDGLVAAAMGKVSPSIDRSVQFRLWNELEFAGIPSFVQATKSRADVLMKELASIPNSGQAAHDDAVALASCVWRISQRPLDDFPTLKQEAIELVNSGRGLSADGVYLGDTSAWFVTAANLVSRAPETPGLGLTIVKQAKTRVEVIQLLGRLGPVAEPSVPALVDLFLDEQTSFFKRLGSGDFLTHANQSQYLMSIISTIGIIGGDPKGYALLSELHLAVASYYGTQFGSQISRVVVDAFANYTPSRTQERDTQLLDDRLLINGLWTIRDTKRHPDLSAKVLIQKQEWKFTDSGVLPNPIPNAFKAGKWSCSQYEAVTVLHQYFPVELSSPSDERPSRDEYRILNNFRLDPVSTLKQINIQGRNENGDEAIQLGIYELTTTTLRVQLAPLGEARPTEFVVEDASLPSGHLLLEFERKLSNRHQSGR